jgi:BatD DUF11 like domain
MRRSVHHRVRVALWAVCAAFFAAAAAPNLAAHAATPAAPSVDATLEPTQISLGESAQLTILTSGSSTLSLALPVVSGLEFRVVGQTRRMEFINGFLIASTSTIIRVTPNEPGVFTIPGPTPRSPPLVLRVNPGSGAGPALPPDNSAPGLHSLAPGHTDANGIRLTPDGSAFVRLEVPKREIYVGESVPAEIQIGMRDGFASSINGLPKLNSSDFTLNNLSFQPEHSQKAVDGKPFTVYTWHSLLSAIKPGSYTLTFEAPVTVRVRTQPRGDSMLDDLLGDPFMQNVFGASVTKNITVTSPENVFTVLPLPTAGRPADFGGAVGSFKASSDISSTTNIAGDPLTLRLHITGTGNFDRVESTMLGSDAEWKTYHPKSAFKQTDPTGFHGEKTFEQPLVASQPGIQTVPALSFSYFDPATRHYETAKSAPLRVTVAPSAAASAAAPPPALASTAATRAADAQSGWRPDHAVTEAPTDRLTPPYLRPVYLAVQSALALLFAGAWTLLHRRERNLRDLRLQRERRRREAIETQRQRMAAASAAADAAEFFSAARSILQQVLSAEWQIEPDQVTSAEVDARLGAQDPYIRRLFALADEANYSGRAPRAADFDRWTTLVEHRIQGEAAA